MTFTRSYYYLSVTMEMRPMNLTCSGSLFTERSWPPHHELTDEVLAGVAVLARSTPPLSDPLQAEGLPLQAWEDSYCCLLGAVIHVLMPVFMFAAACKGCK